MSDSILDSVKQVCGIEPDYTAFDTDILMHTNMAIATLAQLGVGPSGGFTVEDAAATWDQLLGVDPLLNGAKTYVQQKVRLIFDPPATSFGIAAVQEVLKELEWRLNVHEETLNYVDPDPALPEESVFGDPIIIDGGTW